MAFAACGRTMATQKVLKRPATWNVALSHKSAQHVNWTNAARDPERSCVHRDGPAELLISLIAGGRRKVILAAFGQG